MKRNRKPYQICPYCGGHLDYGEKCTCKEEAEQSRQELEGRFCPGKNRQREIRGISCGR